MRYHEAQGALWILLFGIFKQFVQGNEPECRTTNKCTCYQFDEFEFQCPPGDFKIVLHTVPRRYVKIDCFDLPEYDLSIFPDVNVGNLDYFEMKFCPLPNSFSSTLQKFNISKIKSMQLEMASSTSEAVTKELFIGLSTLESLNLSSHRITIQDDFLKNFPNLTHLYLDNNGLQQIRSGMFYYTPNLRILHLARNLISYIPDGIFKNLSNLQQLHLEDNDITILNKYSFMGLRQLKSLELSRNKIVSLDEEVFAELTELVNISLRSNNLNVIRFNIFKQNTALENVKIGNNPSLNLSNYVFANCTSLKSVNIDSSKLDALPRHLFKGSVNLLDISQKNNMIRDVPNNTFKDLPKLRKLNLEGNKITVLPDTVFSSLVNLEELYLADNGLTGINKMLLKKTTSLKILNLRNNKITAVHLDAFYKLKTLTKLDLSFNQFNLDHEQSNTPFDSCKELQELNLSHNGVEHFPKYIIEKTKLIYLNLDNNKISNLMIPSVIREHKYKITVYLNNNNISIVDFLEIDEYVNQNHHHNYNDFYMVFYMSNNPIRCDCHNYGLVKYNNNKLDPVIRKWVDIKLGNSHCSTPREFTHLLVADLKPSQVSCPLDKECPKQCICDYRPYAQCAVVNCSYRNLAIAPTINMAHAGFKQIEVNLEGNKLKTAPDKGIGYDFVTRLILSNNHIHNLSWIPPNINTLTLDRNHLTYIDSKVLRSLNGSTTLQNITLYGNPWSCTCSSVGLQNYLRTHFKKVNPNDVKCDDNTRLIDRKELCKSHLTTTMAIATPILVVLLAIAVVVALYFYYQQEIKVWLYAKNWCLWWVTEEELDKDKTFDIFISYSHKDEEFVIEHLLSVLEAGPNAFKICIHIRDWIPGEYIATQITNSVLDSKRTMVVLSDNFLESVWGKMEFRTAHSQAINEGRARVVVVKYGPLNEEKLDDQLKTYLKTNTYVEWGDRWFWNKLKYALPHSKKTDYVYNETFENVPKMDNTFELATSPTTFRAESTLPLLSSSSLKDHRSVYRV